MRDDVIKYENNFLSNVVVQLDYRPIKRFLETVPNDIIEKLKDDYNFHQGQMLSDVKINIVTGAKIETAIPVWEFSSKDSNIVIQLTQNFLKVNCTKYTKFEDLISHVDKLTKLLENDVDVFNRVGLRYINQIDLDEPNPTDWTEYIDDALISSINSWCEFSKEKIARAMSQIRIVEDDYSLNFNYGIFNPIYPNIAIQKQYILDFDCSGMNINYSEISACLFKYNYVITAAFEKSIKNALRDKMIRIQNHE